ncbi:MAG: bifunctional fructose-bisphosphatase/inositol-phosphate phosphatase [Methanospirillaceae archaeon]|nr:bifunctional fructose-bisphosphatase/inositol-phosphate phosphatase [Methanospirillaceae archaeon]
MDFFTCCNMIADDVSVCIHPFIGTREGDRILRAGADNTPTRVIDDIAESCILKQIEKHMLCARVVSEEAGIISMPGPAGTIFLDPLDGTYNALATIPFYALSISFALNGEILKAFVKDLANNEIFTAEKGKGAFLNGTRIHVSHTADLGTSALCMYGLKKQRADLLDLSSIIRRSRQFGAIALELCYVAAGRLDGFIDIRGMLRVTDAAAGVLVCQEAGGEVTDTDKNPIPFPDAVSIKSNLIATNRILHSDVISHLR